jgi:alkylation response protein AidB-like acyl-CoA dehydrogenase
MVIGEENRGWYHAAVTLDFERAGIGSITAGERDFQSLLDYARNTDRGAGRLSSQPAIKSKLVESYRDMRISRALALRVLDIQANKRVANMEASEMSLHNREAAGRLGEAKSMIYGPYAQLLRDTPYAQNNADGERSWWRLAGRHAAGTMEVQKNIIAQRGLGLPR